MKLWLLGLLVGKSYVVQGALDGSTHGFRVRIWQISHLSIGILSLEGVDKA